MNYPTGYIHASVMMAIDDCETRTAKAARCEEIQEMLTIEPLVLPSV